VVVEEEEWVVGAGVPVCAWREDTVAAEEECSREMEGRG
jgi:hypothetical protein